MAQSRTVNLLPEVFRTKTNKKFLNATMDQLVAEPKLKKIYGYVGRTFSPLYKKADNYIPEIDKLRKTYQLEPSVIVNDSVGNPETYVSYIDLLDQIKHYGGKTENQSRLFENEYYSFDGLIDFDKIVNFNDYYWLDNGPDTVSVYSTLVDPEQTFTVTRDTRSGSYQFSGHKTVRNPQIYLSRGGTYRFQVDQQSKAFWIQSEAGVKGVKRTSQNISTRDVLGVENNGEDVGEIVFNVPPRNAQDFYINMEIVDNIEIATLSHFSDIQGHKLSKIPAGTFDGNYTDKEQLRGKSIIFVNKDIEEIYWTPNGTYDLSNFETDKWPGDPRYYYQGGKFDPGALVDPSLRFQIWQIDFYPDTDVVVLLPKGIVVPEEKKVFTTTGIKYANVYFYKTHEGFYERVPLITANLDTVYYQDGSTSQFVGEFKLLDPNNLVIDVENEILGKLYYSSPNGVVFTNGLRVRFEGKILPENYRDKEYYVEGVGVGIRLVECTTLTTPEFVDTSEKDYLTINRSSIDLNPWSRYNRWFHVDVISHTAEYNNTLPLYNQDARARRPIIEFKPDLKLFGYGTIGLTPIPLFISADAYTLNNDQTNALSDLLEVEGVSVDLDNNQAIIYNDIVIKNGDIIVFPNDVDPVIRNKVYEVQFIQIDALGEDYKVHLNLLDTELVENCNVLILRGPNATKTYWYNGVNWIESTQPKTGINQAPLFDIFDENGFSFSDELAYPNTSFVGSKIFGYKENSAGVTDTYLGFPISYSNFKNIGDIEFQNYFDSDTFTYLISTSNTATKKLNSGFVHKTLTNTTYDIKNVWIKVVEPSKQYQNFTYFSDGINKNFSIDVLIANENTIPYLKVYLNNVLLIETVDYVLQTNEEGLPYVHIITKLREQDKIDLLVYSTEPSNIGSYEVPLNLDLNSKNTDFVTLTLGQMRDHVTTLIENSFINARTLRDNPITQQGGSILQHSGPLSYAALFLTNSRFNFIDSIEYARREYTRFKNKFLETCLNKTDLDYRDPIAGVDAILTAINSMKSKLFPWYYSDMVPYGSEQKTVYLHPVLNVHYRSYEISTIFDALSPSNKAVLVYLNGVQLVHLRDYTFDTEKAGILINDSVELTVDDVIEIHEYQNTNGCYIPETPAKLGIGPKFFPEIYTDSTYLTPTSVIRGHDGSITPTFGDHRDAFLLELERRIYNNIKVQYQENLLSIYDVMPGKFRKTDYSITEFNEIQERGFLYWVGTNKLDYTSNLYFKNSNPFSWNYGLHKDPDGEQLSGSWRAIYRYYYDTETPHITPWEMFGFSEMPDWWEDYYGPAPYTGENLVLWNDVEAGYIAAGPRKGYDSRFERPGITQRIPVDSQGNLKSPMSFLGMNLNTLKMSGSWAVGQMGPVETAWKRSSDYAFAQQIVLALTKPAKYFGLLVDIDNNFKNTLLDQVILTYTKQRIKPEDISFTGDTRSGSIRYVATYLNWIAEYLVGLGITPTTMLVNALENYIINLSYKVAGFTGKEYIKILAEQSSPVSTNDSVIIPDENYKIALLKSAPVNTLTYSAVIIEKSSTGFTVQGYDQNNPYFSFTAPVKHAGAGTVTVLDDSVTIYKIFQEKVTNLPYGYEFRYAQDVVNFLMGYQNYLIEQGFVFDDVESTLGEVKDWILSVKEFIFWAKQAWQEGNVLVLSPVANRIWITSATAVVDEIEDSASGTRILDQNFNVIKDNEYTVLRDGYDFSVELPTDKIIGLIKLNLVQYEHVLIFDNKTIFNDVLYQPELGNRQVRLKIIGQKTADWDGRLEPAGFIYNADNVPEWKAGTDYLKGDIVQYKKQYFTALANLVASDTFNLSDWKSVDYDKIKTGLLPNFALNAGKSKNYYDVDVSIVDPKTNQFGKGLIGFRERPYLGDLNLNEQTQVKFYQGYIKEKGTKNAIDALINTEFNNITSNVSYSEEWAIRVGEYGALETNQFVEVILDEADINANPTTIQFLNSDAGVSESDVYGIRPQDVYKKTTKYNGNIGMVRSNESTYEDDIPTAGYVRLDDVDITIFDLSKYYALDPYLSIIGSGTTIWAAKDLKQDWNVYRVDETDNFIIGVENILDGFINLETKDPHGFVKNDIIVIKNFDARFDGFYRVHSIVGLRHVTVSYSGATDGVSNVVGEGLIFKLTSQRFEHLVDMINYTPLHGWKDFANVWVDSATTGGWAVYQKNEPWDNDYVFNRPIANIAIGDKFGSSITAFNDKQYVVVGSSGANKIWTYSFNSSPSVKRFELNINNTVPGIYSAPRNETGFGYSIASGTSYVAVGAPTTASSRGNVVLFYRNSFGQLSESANTQSIQGPTVGSEFGYSVSMSADDAWLYVGAPGCDNNSGNVYVYRLQANGQYVLYGNTGTLSSNVAGNAAGFRFGSSVKTDATGEYLLVGATQPGRNLTETTGAAYLYVRGIESFVGNTATGNSYTVGDYLLSNVRVYVNSIEKIKGNNYTISANTVNFWANSAPGNGSIISVDTNSFTLLKKLNADDSQALANFGGAVDICKDSCTYIIGAPGYDGVEFNSGASYVFIDQAREYGTIIGSRANATVTSGHSIKIDGIRITFTGTTLTSVVNSINAANIAGIRASIHTVSASEYLQIDSDILTQFKKLQITPAKGTAFVDLGLDNIVTQIQKINHPLSKPNEKFGQHVQLNSDATSLLVSSIDATGFENVTFDSDSTIFDYHTTAFLDQTLKSGAVYLFEKMFDVRNDIDHPAKYLYAQQLTVPNMQKDDEFGSGILFAEINNSILVGSTDPTQYGNVVVFNNSTGKKGWEILRVEDEKVDPHTLNSLYLYNKVLGKKITTLDWIDPIKGKVLGLAEQELDFKTSSDPAMYNRGSNDTVRINNDFYWNESQVGKTWWDLSQVRYVDYEQGSLKFRTANWGKKFPGSEIKVYEWVESSTTPSQYSGDGKPKYPNNNAYSEITKVDTATGIIVKKYYFWVENKSSVDPTIRTRNIPISLIQSIIDNPAAQNIPYAALLSKNSMTLYNVTDKLTSDSVVLHADYDLVRNTNMIHSEYELIGEGRSELIPPKIVAKLIDSLSGLDKMGNNVPDFNLKDSEKYGISIRPRQTMCINRALAVKQAFLYANAALLKYRILDQSNIDGLYAQEDVPLITENEWDYSVPTIEELYYLNTDLLADNYRVLVEKDTSNSNLWVIYQWKQNNDEWVPIRVQAYKATEYWVSADWYADGYGPDLLVDRTVDTYNDLQKLFLEPNELIKILDAGDGSYHIIKVNDDLSTTVVVAQNGTVQFLDPLFNLEEYQSGFDSTNFDSIRFDQNSNVELRYILQALYDDIFVGDLAVEFNGLFFSVINYLLSEQIHLDWIFKTSFISVVHRLRKLEQFPNFIKDNQSYYSEYINEVKPYRTKVREYFIDYEGTEPFYGDVTDFDLPAYYDKVAGLFRSPSGELVTDAELWTQPEYTNWNQNKTLEVELVILENPGTSYTQTPDVIFDNTGTGGTGAAARAVVDFGTGQLTGIELLSPGHGYRFAPQIRINGIGYGAKAYPQMINRTTRGLKTIIKFDRIDYTHNILEWTANTFYSNGNVVSYYDSITNSRNVYLFNGNTLANSGTKFDTVSFQSVSNLKVWTANTAYAANSLVYYREPYLFGNIFSTEIAFGANNEIQSGNVANLNFANLQIKQGSTITVEYVAASSTPNKGIYTVKDVSANVIVIYEDTLANIAAGPNIALGTWRPAINTGNVYQVTTAFTSNSSFDTANLVELLPARNMLKDTIRSISNDWDPVLKPNVANVNVIDYSVTLAKANDRIMALYQPDSNSPIRDIKQLVRGIDYPGIIIDGVKFDVNVKSIVGNVLAFEREGSSNIGYITSNDLTKANLGNLGVVNGDTIYVLDSTYNEGLYTIANAISYSNLVVSGNTMLGLGQTITEANGNIARIYSWNGVDANVILDSNIASYFHSFGTLSNIADYTINGTSFVDVFNSHAPEELVPGSTFDHLNIGIFTNASVSTGNVGYRIIKNMNDENQYIRISDYRTTTLAQDLLIDDNLIHLTNANVLPPVADLSGKYGVVYINGERIVYYDIDYSTNTLRRFRRGTQGTGAADIHLAGSRVSDASAGQYLPVNGNTQFFSYLQSNATITSDVIQFFAGNGVIYSNNTTLANLEVLTPSTGNIVVITGSPLNSGVFYITKANANTIVTANSVVNELSGNVVSLAFYSNVSPNIAYLSTEVTQFITTDPSYKP